MKALSEGVSSSGLRAQMGSGPERPRQRSSPSGEFSIALYDASTSLKDQLRMPRADHFAKSAARARRATAALTAELPPRALPRRASRTARSFDEGQDLRRLDRRRIRADGGLPIQNLGLPSVGQDEPFQRQLAFQQIDTEESALKHEGAETVCRTEKGFEGTNLKLRTNPKSHEVGSNLILNASPDFI